MSIMGFDGKEYDSVEAMQAAMAQQDRDKLRARGKDIGFDDAFFGSNEFTQFEKENPYNGIYATVVQNDPYGFGGAPRTRALTDFYTQYLQRTNQQDKIKTEVEDGLFGPTKGRKEEEEETMVDYYRLPDGTGFAKNRATREAVPQGAVQISQQDFLQLAPAGELLPTPPSDEGRAFTPTSPSTQVKGKTGEELEKALIQKQAERIDKETLPPGVELTPEKLQESFGEIVLPSIGMMGQVTPAEVSATLNPESFEQGVPSKTAVPVITATQTGKVDEIVAARGQLADQAVMKAAQGQLSPETMAKAATQELDPRATTRYQIAELFATIEEGKPLPAWASPAVRRVNAVMQQRGLGASSMAAAAAVQAVMESGIAIAAQDAQKYAAIQVQNLSNQQQVVLQNAAASAQMDMANLNARQQANASNAKAFLGLDMQNLTNEQQAATISYQGQLQAMLTDQAQDNAIKQINAKNQIEIDKFFTDLGVQIESATLNRKAAIEQYNVSQQSAMSQFNNQMNASREQFNASMSAQISQSNAQWRRTINTSNTAAQNAANQTNAMNLLGISQQGLANLWQAYRDQAAWSMQISENNLARAHNAAMQAASISASGSMYDDKFEDFLIVKTIDNIFNP